MGPGVLVPGCGKLGRGAEGAGRARGGGLLETKAGTAGKTGPFAPLRAEPRQRQRRGSGHVAAHTPAECDICAQKNSYARDLPTFLCPSGLRPHSRGKKKNTEAQVKRAFSDPVFPFGQEPTETCQTPATSYHPTHPLAQFNLHSFFAEHFDSGSQCGFPSTDEREEDKYKVKTFRILLGASGTGRWGWGWGQHLNI